MTDLTTETAALAVDETANTNALGALITAIQGVVSNQQAAIAAAVAAALQAAQATDANAVTIMQGVDSAVQAATARANNEFATLTPPTQSAAPPT